MEKLAEAQAGAEVARHSEAGLQAALLAMRQEHEAALATLAGALREADEHVLGAREAEYRRRRQSVGELTLATAALHAQAQAQAQAEERVVAAQGAAADAQPLGRSPRGAPRPTTGAPLDSRVGRCT